VFALHALIHETLHGYSKMDRQSYRGVGVVVEEVTNEVAARAVLRGRWNGLLSGADVLALPDRHGPGARGYDRMVYATIAAIRDVAKTNWQDASARLERASLSMKGNIRAAASPEAHLANFVSRVDGLGGMQRMKLAKRMRAIQRPAWARVATPTADQPALSLRGGSDSLPSAMRTTSDLLARFCPRRFSSATSASKRAMSSG
jgi:hypothetical protein